MARTRPMKKALRYAVPATVAGATVAAVGLVPALASSGGSPDLPKVTAEELVAKIAASDTQRLSGTVRITTDLGLPALPGMGSGGYGGGREEGAGDADPRGRLTELASGSHTLRVAVDGPDRQRLSIVGKSAEYSLVRNGGDVWAYDSATGTVHHTVLPRETERGAGREEIPGGLEKATPQKAAQEVLKAVDATTSVSVDGTAKVAGQDAYQLLIEPKQADSTVGSVRIAVDADSGVPLKFTLTPKDGGKAAVDVGFTEVDFAKPDADTFDFKPPEGAKITEERLDGARNGSGEAPHKDGRGGDGKGRDGAEGLPSGLEVVGEGWGSVARVELPGGGPVPGADAAQEAAPEARKLLDGFTEEVKGDFGTGRFFGTRLVNVLITDDGTVYVGAVTREGLVKAAGSAGGAG
ncbi:outer membrane lipoprotein carrier protein LolA [Streptomyces sp. HK10]|uniref:LolA family protein n=1 Tax=Streptomyces sp. HK10 TaxID=3373255 RepID=UPI00374A0A2C